MTRLLVLIACAALIAASIIGFFAMPQIDFAEVNDALSRFSESVQSDFTPVRAATETSIDAKAAANLDEDLDWNVASAAKTDAALLKFLIDHPNRAHAVEAQLKLERIAPREPDSEPPPAPAPAPEPPPAPAPEPPPQSLKPQPVIIAVPLLMPPVVEVANAPPHEDAFAKLETMPKAQTVVETRTIIRWRPDRARRVVEWRYVWPRYRRHYRPPPPNFFQAFWPRR